MAYFPCLNDRHAVGAIKIVTIGCFFLSWFNVLELWMDKTVICGCESSTASVDAQLWRSQRALTAVPDDADGGVALTETRDRSEAHLVGLGLDELGQVVAHQLPFVDGPVHGDLLLPPTLQPHLDRKRKSSCVNTDSLRLTGTIHQT